MNEVEILKLQNESLQRLVDNLVEGLDIRGQINEELRTKIKQQDEVLCPWFKTPCRREGCVAYTIEAYVDTWGVCKAFNITLDSSGDKNED